ncbi:MAG: alpha/beta fold hydrolase [Alphaproteobacteria bacterium]|nr:alpha/beta fold hydrolase [Alphaproteobacteria bacterium]
MAVQLAAAEYGDGSPVAILHGLFGSGRNWQSIARQLAKRHRVLAFDLRNHGASPWADGMSYREMVDDLRASLRSRGIEHAAMLGHSMGGKVAMLAALLHPAEVDRLVVVDIAPVPNPPTLLAYVRALRAVDLRGITRRSEADVRLARAIPDPKERGLLLQNLVIAEGKAHWRLNLEAIEREFSHIVDFPQLPVGTVFNRSTLFVAGANSAYIRLADEVTITRLFPRARIIRIEGAGHWIHAEQPQSFLQTVAGFLSGSA